jgi:hypothetical protein
MKSNDDTLFQTISVLYFQVFHGVVHLLVKDIMSPYPVVRKQARQALLVLSEVTGKTVKEMLEPLPKDLISETVSFTNVFWCTQLGGLA